MQKRRLGRTNLQVSIVGFGGTWISQLRTTEAVGVVRKAFDCGINYFDSCSVLFTFFSTCFWLGKTPILTYPS